MNEPSPKEWAVAYANQAHADFQAWNFLNLKGNELPSRQKLHFLQMACEKLGKAFVYWSGETPASIQASHVYIAKQVPRIFRELLLKFGENPKERQFFLKHVRHIAREIELLSPAVDDGGRRPDNCEYPWVDELKRIHVPAQTSFGVLRLIDQPTGRKFLKLIVEGIRTILNS